MNPQPLVPSLPEQLDAWLQAVEGEHFEFKEAVNQFSMDELAKCCCAAANERGGRVILGVTNKRPRKVAGTQAFAQFEETRKTLMNWLKIRIDVMEILHPDGRVLVFEIPSRPVGLPIKYDGRYWSREADSLVPMSEDRLREVFSEAGRDFSADVCPEATLSYLEPGAIEEFRRRWMAKSGNGALAALTQEQVLRDADLLVDAGVTWAALVLLGTRSALVRLLGQAEVILEYRSSDVAGPAQLRKEYKEGFFSYYEDIWTTINLRNDVQHYQDGLFVLDIPTFDERSVREVVLNAICHRDYQLGGNIFLRQYPRRLVVESPGGLPLGVTPSNVLDRQSPRNRRIANAFALCGLVERSGQGMNLIFEQSIRQGKPRPDLSGTDAYAVVLSLGGEVSDPRFVQFLEKVGRETSTSFDAHDFLVLDRVHREETLSPVMQPRLRRLAELGVIETIGRGKGVRYLLSRRFYAMVGRTGVYTRRRGLDDGTHKELLLRHLRDNAGGSALGELHQILPQLGRRKVQFLLHELLSEGRVSLEGTRRWARWKAKDEAPASGA